MPSTVAGAVPRLEIAARKFGLWKIKRRSDDKQETRSFRRIVVTSPLMVARHLIRFRIIRGRNMRVALVTGSAGFIGSFVCKTLLQEGWRVVGVDCM